MDLITLNVKAPKAYLVPLGDMHIGSFNVDEKKLEGYIKWVKEHPNSYIFLMGDIFDTATRDSLTSPFDQSLGINEAFEYMTNLIKPVKKKIIGCISGNHERRLTKYAGLDILEMWCNRNQIRYCGDSAVIVFNIKSISYIFFAHHTTGGGQTIGGKLNRVFKLSNIFVGADCYLGGHNHSKALGEDAIYFLENGKIKLKRIFYIDCGSFQKYPESYAEESALPPSHTGAPRIRMSGIEKDLHISF